MSRYLVLVAVMFWALAARASAQAPFPTPDDATDFKVVQKVSDVETFYSFTTEKTVSDLFDFYRSQLSLDGWTAVYRSERVFGGAPTGQMQFFREDGAQSITVIAQYDSYSNGNLDVAIIRVTDQKAALAFHDERKNAEKNKEEPPSLLEFSFMKELEAVKTAINARDFETLSRLSSPWFEASYSEKYIRERLEDLYVDKLFPVFAEEGKELGIVVVEFECRVGAEQVLGTKVMYFDRVGEHWRFNGLPFGSLDIRVPGRMLRRFSEEGTESN